MCVDYMYKLKKFVYLNLVWDKLEYTDYQYFYTEIIDTWQQ